MKNLQKLDSFKSFEIDLLGPQESQYGGRLFTTQFGENDTQKENGECDVVISLYDDNGIIMIWDALPDDPN